MISASRLHPRRSGTFVDFPEAVGPHRANDGWRWCGSSELILVFIIRTAHTADVGVRQAPTAVIASPDQLVDHQGSLAVPARAWSSMPDLATSKISIATIATPKLEALESCMKTLFLSVAIVVALLGAAGACLWWNYDAVVAMILKPQTSAAGDITEESFGLVAPDGTRFALDELETALGSLSPAPGPRPLVLFVHGFGPDPDGEFGLYTMGELAKGANVDVLMFTWPSWISMIEFPVLNARAASEKLITLLQEIVALRAPDKALAQRPVVIVGHSMAGEVFRFVGESAPDLPKGLITRLLLAVPETALPDHRHWMEKLDFTDEIFVFVNSDDPALQVTTRMYNTARLGRTLTNLDGTSEPLAHNADYILLDPENWRHYFFVSGQRSEAIDQIFADILTTGAAALKRDDLRPEPAGNVFVVVGPGAEG